MPATMRLRWRKFWRSGEAGVLGEESATLGHLRSDITMCRWVYAVETMGKHAYRGEVVLEGSTVGADVDAVGQSADDEHIGNLGSQVAHEALAEVAPIVGALACAYDAHHATRVEGGVATVVEQ